MRSRTSDLGGANGRDLCYSGAAISGSIAKRIRLTTCSCSWRYER